MAKITYNKIRPVRSAREMFDRAVREAPNKPAYMFRNPLNKDEITTVTFKEAVDEINALGTALANRGIIQGHVAITADNSYRWIITYFTALKGTGVFVPVDKELTIPEICHVVDHSDSEALFYSGGFTKSLEELKDNLPNIKTYILIDMGAGVSEATDEDGITYITYDALLEEGKRLLAGGNMAFLNMRNDPEQMKQIIYTSGTTGDPKGVMLSEHAIISMINNGLRVAKVYTRCLSVLPYHHTYEGNTDLISAFFMHNCLCINENKRTVLKNLQLYKPDYIFLVPAYCEAFYKNIKTTIRKKDKEKSFALALKASRAMRKVGIDMRKKLFKDVHEAFGGNLKKIICGGAPIRPEIAAFFDDIGIDFCNGYGITECAPLVSVNTEEYNDNTTTGFVLPNLRVRLENVDRDGEGEICVKGDNVLMGYYKNPEQTAEVLKDGWFYTGDYGRINELGQLAITGRKKNMIVLRNGKNIFPEELENVIMDIPFVNEVVVSGVSDGENGEIGIAAEVYLNADELKNMNIPDEEALKALKGEIAKAFSKYPRYKQISQVTLRDTEFPKTTTAKIKRGKKEPTPEELAEKARKEAEKAARKAQRDAERAAKKAEDAEKKAVRDAEKAEQKAIRDAERAEQKAIKEVEDAEKKAVRDAEKAAKKAEDAEKKAIRDAERAEQRAERKAQKKVEDAEKKAVRDAERAEKKAQKVAEKAEKKAQKEAEKEN